MRVVLTFLDISGPLAQETAQFSEYLPFFSIKVNCVLDVSGHVETKDAAISHLGVYKEGELSVATTPWHLHRRHVHGIYMHPLSRSRIRVSHRSTSKGNHSL